jgi:hypothetical protein
MHSILCTMVLHTWEGHQLVWEHEKHNIVLIPKTNVLLQVATRLPNSSTWKNIGSQVMDHLKK